MSKDVDQVADGAGVGQLEQAVGVWILFLGQQMARQLAGSGCS